MQAVRKIFKSKKPIIDDQYPDENHNEARSVSHHNESRRRGRRSRSEDNNQPSTSCYHTSTPIRPQRKIRSCFEQRQNTVHPYENYVSSPANRLRRPIGFENGSARQIHDGTYVSSAIPGCLEESFGSDMQPSVMADTIRNLYSKLGEMKDRKNFYKELYRNEKRERIQDRENRDLVEKKLIADIRGKDNLCRNLERRVESLEQECQQLRQSFSVNARNNVSVQVTEYISSSSFLSGAGAGEALSNVSGLLNTRCINDSPDKLINFRHSDQFSLDKPQNDSTEEDNSLLNFRCSNRLKLEKLRDSSVVEDTSVIKNDDSGTILEEDLNRSHEVKLVCRSKLEEEVSQFEESDSDREVLNLKKPKMS